VQKQKERREKYDVTDPNVRAGELLRHVGRGVVVRRKAAEVLLSELNHLFVDDATGSSEHHPRRSVVRLNVPPEVITGDGPAVMCGGF
jgi:hypothetical protein